MPFVESHPLQLVKVEPFEADAVSVTDALPEYIAVPELPLQLIAPAFAVIFPLPLPDFVMLSGY